MLNRLIRGLAALLVLVALTVGTPVALLSWVGNPLPPGGWSEVHLLTDRTLIGGLAVLAWALWVQMSACIVIEVVAAVRGVTPGHVRFALGGQQDLARLLVTSVLALGLGAGTLASASAAANTPTATRADGGLAGVHQVHHIQGHHANDVELDQRERGAGAEITVTVPTTVWSLAETHLGDGARWQEVLDLNRGQTLADGASLTQGTQTIPAGTTVRLPGDATNLPEQPALLDLPGEAAYDPGQDRSDHQENDRGGMPRHQVEVEPKDTLWDIAETELDDPTRWPELYRASQETVQPGGERLVDPDHIEPGWTITVPAQPGGPQTDRGDDCRDDRGDPGDPGTPGEPAPDDREQGLADPGEVDDRDQPEQGQQDEDQQVQADQQTTQTSDAAPDSQDSQDEEQGELTALRALLATAACLSAGALGVVVANRRRQFRRRRIGRTIASTAPELAEVEQAILEHGSAAQEDVEFLDRALRHVAASCKVAGTRLPHLGAAVLGDEDLTLLFTHPAVGAVPEGWTATDDARAWMLPRWTFLEEDLESQPAPYPALVSVGLDEGGRTWYLDLEALGMCGIGGEPQQVADLVRFMVAELAVNGWAEGCEVLMADQFAAETIRLNPVRLRQVARGDALARAAVLSGEMGEVEQNLDADLLTRRRDGLLLDTTNPIVVVLATRPRAEFIGDVEARDRSRVVVVHGDEESPAVELSGDGLAFLPIWGIRVRAFTMKSEQAAPMADLIAATRNLEDEPVPATQSDDGPLGKYARVDGSLREEYTEPRHTDGNDPSSQLPEADEVYLATAATTTEDLAAVAPSVPEEIRVEIAALDPTLDQDVADWFDESSPRPKVHLLGPVSVTALNGGDPAALDNAGGTVSFIAYLAWQDHGVTGERAAAACGWKTQKTVQNRATNARYLLGTRPDGSEWLPDASMSASARRGHSPTYELVRDSGGVLNNPDLFSRLKHRAQRRGDDGCEEDLVTALSLVTGVPFEGITESRFRWVFKEGQQRPDQILAGAIHDAAHTLATRAVAKGRTDLVQLACDAARRANPHSDIPWLDKAAATEAESGHEAASQLVREQVLDRIDEDLPPRSEEVVEQREWGAATG